METPLKKTMKQKGLQRHTRNGILQDFLGQELHASQGLYLHRTKQRRKDLCSRTAMNF
jgi:hypothetical protein